MTLVIAPRAVARRFADQPWSVVMAAAEANTDGLRIWKAPDRWGQERPKDSNGYVPGFDDWDGIVLLRQGDTGPQRSQTMWHQQNWTA